MPGLKKLARAMIVPGRFIAGALLMGLVATGVSFGVMRYLAEEHIQARRPDPARMWEANQLRDFNNELVQLCNGYIRRYPTTGAPSVEVQAWIDREFRPELQYLRERIHGSSVREHPLALDLISATDRAIAMARHGSSAAVRRQTLAQVSASSAAVEGWIDSLGLGNRLARPAEAPRF